MGPLIPAFLFVLQATVAHGHWWRWAALGIGIAWVVSLVRLLQALVLAGGLAALVAHLRRK